MIMFLSVLLIFGALFVFGQSLATYHSITACKCTQITDNSVRIVSAVAFITPMYALAELNWLSNNLHITTPPFDEIIWLLIEIATVVIFYSACTLIRKLYDVRNCAGYCSVVAAYKTKERAK